MKSEMKGKEEQKGKGLLTLVEFVFFESLLFQREERSLEGYIQLLFH